MIFVDGSEVWEIVVSREAWVTLFHRETFDPQRFHGQLPVAVHWGSERERNSHLVKKIKLNESGSAGTGHSLSLHCKRSFKSKFCKICFSISVSFRTVLLADWSVTTKHSISSRSSGRSAATRWLLQETLGRFGLSTSKIVNQTIQRRVKFTKHTALCGLPCDFSMIFSVIYLMTAQLVDIQRNQS